MQPNGNRTWIWFVLLDVEQSDIGAAPGGVTPMSARSLSIVVDGGSPARVAAAHALAERFRSSTRVEVDEIMADGHRHIDPYAMEGRFASGDAVVLVAPRSRGVRKLVIGPVVAGRPVAIVQADRPDHLPAESADPDPTASWVVAAMAKNVFLDATEQWAQRLDETIHRTVDLRADRARRSDLIDALRTGPGVVLYAGHGSPRGWAGYQALRVAHFDQPDVPGDRPAVGLMMAFACQTLSRPRQRWPFGSHLVQSGVVRSYLAPAMSVFTADAEALADIVVELLTRRTAQNVASLMVDIENAVVDNRAATRAWRTFRLVGDPTTQLTY